MHSIIVEFEGVIMISRSKLLTLDETKLFHKKGKVMNKFCTYKS